MVFACEFKEFAAHFPLHAASCSARLFVAVLRGRRTIAKPNAFRKHLCEKFFCLSGLTFPCAYATANSWRLPSREAHLYRTTTQSQPSSATAAHASLTGVNRNNRMPVCLHASSPLRAVPAAAKSSKRPKVENLFPVPFSSPKSLQLLRGAVIHRSLQERQRTAPECQTSTMLFRQSPALWSEGNPMASSFIGASCRSLGMDHMAATSQNIRDGKSLQLFAPERNSPALWTRACPAFTTLQFFLLTDGTFR